MPELMALTCPVCGAPLSPGDAHCAFCGSAIFIKADTPQLNLKNLNQSVIQEHIADFRTRIRKDHYDVEAHYGLGMAYYSLGLPDEAIDELTNAAKLMPENADIQTQLAVVLHQSVLTGKASAEGPMKERLAKALTLDPTSFEANLLRADILQRRGDYDGALHILQPVIGRDPVRGHAKRIEIIEAIGEQRRDVGDVPGLQWAIAEIAPTDDSRARSLAVRFLRQHQDVLPNSLTIRVDPTTLGPIEAPAIDTHVAVGRSPAPWGKTILIALAALVVRFVVLAIASSLLSDAQDQITGWRTAAFLLVFLAWIASPFIAAVLYRRSHRPDLAGARAPVVNRDKVTISRADLLAGRASLTVLTASIDRLVTIAPARLASTPTLPRSTLSAPLPVPEITPVNQASSIKANVHWFDGNR